MTVIRCGWSVSDPLYIRYHDEEWGTPCHDDRRWFEIIVLNGVQAGLSWFTVLRRRENYRAAFDNFDVRRVAAYDDAKVAALLQDPGIIRNRAKVKSAVNNARAFVRIQEEFGSFDAYIWPFVENKTIVNAWTSLDQIPAETPTAQAISADMRKRGFTFAGPTIIYAMMQSCGLVNDHLVDCFRYHAVSE